MLGAMLWGRKTPIVDQIRLADRSQQPLPLPVIGCGNKTVVVRAPAFTAVDRVGRGVARQAVVAATRRSGALRQISRERGAIEVDDRLLHRNLDSLTAARDPALV